MAKFTQWRNFWKRVRKNWSVKHRLIIRNETTQHDSFTFLLSPRNIFVTVTVSAVALVALTAVIIAFTPLRYYIPGYTTPDEHRKYKEAADKMATLQEQYSRSDAYLQNLRQVLDETYLDTIGAAPKSDVASDGEQSLEAATLPSDNELALRSEAGDLLQAVSTRQMNDGVSISTRADIQNLFLQPPTTGTILTAYSVPQNQYGIDVANREGTLITSAAEGMVVFAGYDVNDGNVIIVQHHDNVLTVYKNNKELLKNKGAKVAAGEPIAKMGHTGITDKGNHLHFELWHNGFPLNPLDYLTLK
jgi:murein DD-endopeptidase MepM/ murein hydrolase activator NlpD